MRFSRDLILALLAAMAMILALEAGLRLAHQHYDGYLFEPELERGYSLRPHAEGWADETYVQINSDGLRDRERPVQRPAGAIRVAVLGGSFAEAREVSLDETFAAEMQRRLMPVLEPHGSRVDVLNFGVTGYSHSQEYLTLRNHVWKYDPQIVVMLWDQLAILRNTWKTDADSVKVRVPFYGLRDGRLEPIEPPPARRSLRYPTARQIATKNLMSYWMNSSYLLCMLNATHLQLQQQIQSFEATARRIFRRGAPVAASRQGNYVDWWPVAPYLPEMQEDWAISEAFLLAMKAECDRHGAEFLFVIVGGDMQSYPDAAVRNAFVRRYGLASLNESDLRWERFCQANGIRVLPLGAPMGDYAATHGVALHGDRGWIGWGHWNKLGNRLAGDFIAEELRERSSVVQAWAAGRR